MKNILSFDEFLNESSLNEAKSTAWVSLPTGTWTSEYSIPSGAQKDLTNEIIDILGPNFKIINPSAEGDEKLLKEIEALGYDDTIFNYTTKRESSTVEAYKLKNGNIAVAVFSTYGSVKDSDAIIWIIGK
jgi:hypothetical protein